MKKVIRAVIAIALIVPPILAKDMHAPLPASVIAAKTVYIDNQTGHAEITDRAYDALSKWGRFKILMNAKDADLILRFTADTEGRPTPPHNDIDISPTPVLFSVFDQTNDKLWFASKNKPFHSQTRLDVEEFKKRIDEQEKSK
ncbi:MAG TPA: hypothetical protein VK709_12295 [Candidatus Saccharimonadales bacterium]|jgi:hypothetical protein|nr:hypothetical protein [Candidatus Saccharimonadales bacterium]